MAVFTKLNEKDVIDFISTYNIGKLEKFEGIVEGIENTNYKITCGGIFYVLTIFEKRVDENDLPFFIDLKLYLSKNNFKCPRPIKNKHGKIINSLKNKRAVIISFIEGKKIEVPNVNDCEEVGRTIGDLHNLTINFNQKRENSLGIEEWKLIFKKCKNNNTNQFKDIINELKNEINFIEKSWPKNLPSGIIHGDLFKDNIFFRDDRISGVIDFYFSCYHFFLYDICIVINDWCFQNNGMLFKYDFLDAIIKGYRKKRKFTSEELNVFNVVLRAATVRILMTRLHDYIFHPKDAIVVKKDPFQYYNILKWHQENRLIL